MHGRSASRIDLVRSVLVVVDMQNDFCHPGLVRAEGHRRRAHARPIPAMPRLLPAWRAAGGTVLWLNWGVRADRAEPAAAGAVQGQAHADGVGYAEASPEDHGRALVPGDWGAQVVDELAVLPATSPSSSTA
jgi:ureidoacrylate peracid hydrolase